MANPPAPRIVSIDVLRGLAIVFMVPANMAPSVYVEPHAFWFRIITSFPAPTFIAVAGMMIVLAQKARPHDWKYYLGRGVLLVAMAVLVDALIFGTIPFTVYDVLYVIGIACPLTYFFARLPRYWQFALIALIFLITPVLQRVFGYTDYPGDYYFWGSRPYEAFPTQPTGVIQHLFIDGWFPIFPWLGMGFVGALIAQVFLVRPQENASRRMLLTALVLLVVGLPLWIAFPGPMYDRNGLTELFYPPTVGFLITACGMILALLGTICAPESPIYAPFRLFGECALLMYVLHLAMISYLLEPVFFDKRLPVFLILAFLTLMVLAAIAAGVRKLKAARPDRPYAARFLLGG